MGQLMTWLGVLVVLVFTVAVLVALAALVSQLVREARELPDVHEWVNQGGRRDG